jgi:urease accessory protein
MRIIKEQWTGPTAGKQPVPVWADRRVLAKMRWRGVAEDGAEFGFELREALRDGTPVFADDTHVYHLAQKPEPLFSIPIADAIHAAQIGWMIGNLHFTAQISADSILVEADGAIRQMLVRESIPFAETLAVFQPLRAHMAHRH